MDSRPEVSVVIPTRDRKHLLQRALRVVLEQEDVELEVIVVDDGSRDGTQTVLRTIEDRRLRVVTHRDSRGVAAARNAGIAEAGADWLAFLDDDDLWSPRKLRVQLDALNAKRASFAYGAAVDVDERGRITLLDPAPPPEDLFRRLLRRNAIPAGSSNVVALAGLVRDVGGFDERLSQAADWDLWIRLAGAGRAAACEEVLVGYSLHPGNMLLASPKRVSRELAYIAAKHRAAGERLDATPDRSAYFRWVATGHRRAGRRLSAASGYARAAVTGGGARDLLRAASAIVGERITLAARRRDGIGAGNELSGSFARPAWLDRYAFGGEA
jgi:glycosyltransferase involved in cell wall biosynthesis